MSFLGEIRRRKVFQVAAVYSVVAWLIIQVVDVVSVPLNLPEWFATVAIVLLAIGFPIAVILAWAFDLTPRGIEPESNISRADLPSPPPGQALNFVLQGLVLLAVVFLVLDQYVFNQLPGSEGTANPISRSRVTRFDYDLPEGQTLRAMNRSVLAISPLGDHFVYNTEDGLYLRRMRDFEARLLPETEPALESPAFSPDGQSIAYWDWRNQLRRISVNGGAPVVIATVAYFPRGLSWEDDGKILFGQPDGIYSVEATNLGSAPELIIPVDEEMLVYGPQLLPDGDTVLFSVGATGNPDATQVVAHSLSTNDQKVLIPGGGGARYVSTGHIVYAFEDELLAVAFDVESLAISGEVIPLVQGVTRHGGIYSGGGSAEAAHYDVSDDGTLVYLTGATPNQQSLLWVDRTGNEEPIRGAFPSQISLYVYPRIPPDGRSVAFDDRGQNNDLWVYSFERETLTRLNVGATGGQYPVWNTDSSRIAYSARLGEVEWMAANNNGQPELLATISSGLGGAFSPYFFANSEQSLVFRTTENTETGNDIGMVTIGGNDEVVALIAGPNNELNAELSPNGRFIAYQSDESGQYEIYVRPFPDVDADLHRISNAGGLRPVWSRDGLELFYLEPGPPSRLMSVSVETSEYMFQASLPTVVLADWPYRGDGPPAGRPYDVAADGRFLVIRDGIGPAPQINVVQNWFEELRQQESSN